MRLPVKINPNPLIFTPVEIRFNLKDSEANFFSKINQSLASQFSSFESLATIPKELKDKDEQFRFSPDFKFKNEQYSISFGNNVMLFETVKDYPLWANYSSFIKSMLQIILPLDLFSSISRIGLRYGSIFEMENIAEVLQYYPKISVPGYIERVAHSNFDLTKEEHQITLQIADKAIINKSDRTFVGLYVDIDAYLTKELSPMSDIFSHIENLHLTQKQLFFEHLLKPEFLEKLNPLY